MSKAPERRMVFSRSRERRVSVSEGRFISIEGEVMGESSVVIVKIPSKGRSGKGVVTSAVMWVWTLGFVSGNYGSSCEDAPNPKKGRKWGNSIVCLYTSSSLISHLQLHIHLQNLAPELEIDRMLCHLAVCFLAKLWQRIVSR